MVLISLLDLIADPRRPNRAPGGGGLLAAVLQRKQAEEQAGQPRQPAQLPAGQPTGQPGLPSPERVPESAIDLLRQQNRAILGQTIMNVTGKGLTPQQRTFTDEVAEAEIREGAGRRGRSFLPRIVAREIIPGLTEAQQRRVDNRALVTAGLMTLASSRPGLGGIAEGLLYGQAHAAGMIQGMLEAAETQGELEDRQKAAVWIRDTYETVRAAHPDWTELEVYKAVGRRADEEGRIVVEAPMVEKIVERQKNFQAGVAEATESKEFPGLFVRDGEFFDADGERVNAEQIQQLREQQRQEGGFTLSEGQVRFDAEGNVIARGPQPPAGEGEAGAEPATKAQSEAAGAALTLESAVDTIEDNLSTLPSFTSLSRLVPRGLRGEERKQFDSATDRYNAQVAKAISGAAVSDTEREVLARAFSIQPGDTGEVIRDKIRQARQFVENQRAIAEGRLPTDVRQQGAGAETPTASSFFDAFSDEEGE